MCFLIRNSTVWNNITVDKAFCKSIGGGLGRSIMCRKSKSISRISIYSSKNKMLFFPWRNMLVHSGCARQVCIYTISTWYYSTPVHILPYDLKCVIIPSSWGQFSLHGNLMSYCQMFSFTKASEQVKSSFSTGEQLSENDVRALFQNPKGLFCYSSTEA